MPCAQGEQQGWDASMNAVGSTADAALQAQQRFEQLISGGQGCAGAVRLAFVHLTASYLEIADLPTFWHIGDSCRLLLN
jgi:hypothetical protein